jgi:hypothetical protein
LKEFELTIFNAQQEEEKWMEYVRGHAAVLNHLGIDQLTSFKPQPCQNPNQFVLTARNTDGFVVGGVRIQKQHDNFKFPVQEAIEEIDPKINVLINFEKSQGTCELCGLWVARDHGRLGLAHFLMKSSIAYATHIDINSAFGLSSPFAINIFRAVGYEELTELGDNGTFIYPTPEFVSTVILIRDLKNVPNAEEIHRQKIFEIRKKLTFQDIDIYNNQEIKIHYNFPLS